MKRTNIFSRWMCLAMLLGCVGVSWGQTLNSAGETITANRTVTLNSSMTLTGSITVNPGVILTINGNNNVITTFTAEDETTSGKYSFIVNGTLIMNNVILDGGNTGNVGNSVNGGGEGAINAGATFKKSGTAIIAYNAATVKLTNVTARNLYANPKSSASFIYASYEKTGTTNEVISGRASIEMNQVTVENCLNNNDDGIIYTSSEYMRSTFTLENCSIRNCMVKANNTGTGYGGVIKCAGKTDCNFTMKNSLMQNCWGSGWGGAVLWAANGNNCKAVFEGCTFMNNYARYLGGAISSEAIVELIGCKILNNTAGFGGGGIAAFPFTLADSENGNTQQAIGLELSNNTISGNKTLYITNKGEKNVVGRVQEGSPLAPQTLTQEIETGFNPRYTILDATDVYYPSGGGGIWVLMNKNEWDCSLSIKSGNIIENNTSAYNGGGVFLYKQRPYTRDMVENGDKLVADSNEKITFLTDYTSGGKTSMELAAEIKDNKAECSGGGAAVGADNTLKEFPNVTVTDGKITLNKALNGNGGGIYMPGGKFSIQGGAITKNEALIAEETGPSSSVGNGGGIAIAEGEFNILADDFEISENEAKRYGGGLYVFKATNEVKFNGGTIDNNTALAGGGVSLEGNVDLVMAANVKYNRATNGGGMYLGDGATMKFGEGLLCGNQANLNTEPMSNETAYQSTVNEVTGVGGGLFMDSNTSLTFTDNENLGLYGNIAANGADDIFANGNGTTVTLPDVSKMVLTEFVVPTKALNWKEDYIIGDTGYENGTKKKDTNDDIRRYRESLKLLKKTYDVDANEYTNYLCLALGYRIIFATIEKYGLKDGESAIFKVYPVDGNMDSTTPYASVLLTGSSNSNSVSKRIALAEGTWRVEETKWSWNYITSQEDEQKAGKDISENNSEKDNTFTFTNIPNSTDIKYDEAIIENKMGGTSTTAQ